MKYLIFLLFPILGISQTGLSGVYDDAVFSNLTLGDANWVIGSTEPSERITKVELKKDTLYVYKKMFPNSNVSCAVYHPPGTSCSWDEPWKERDVYVVKNGSIVLIGSERPKYKVVEKTIKETIESW
ncbi:MAG: hypothetical protein NXH86_04015 [Flavobacteriaceae bacterium]|nr:hypothetical protein [Flavobacteriaceae bacterium]